MNVTETRVIRAVLAFIWLFTAAVSLGLYPIESSLALLDAVGLHGQAGLLALYAGATLDVLLGLATLLVARRSVWLIQGVVIVAYSLILTLTLPEFWLHPFGPLLKNSAVLTLLWLLYQHGGKTT
jgi:hypothetical protein